MANAHNSFSVTGFLTGEPNVKEHGKYKSAFFVVAENVSYKKNDGTEVKQTNFFPVKEIVEIEKSLKSADLKTGDLVDINGQFHTGTYTNKENKTVSDYHVKLEGLFVKSRKATRQAAAASAQ